MSGGMPLSFVIARYFAYAFAAVAAAWALAFMALSAAINMGWVYEASWGPGNAREVAARLASEEDLGPEDIPTAYRYAVVDEAGEVRLRPAPYHAERLCGLENASVRFDSRAALRGVDLTILRGERVALLGGNGCGKTTALRLLTGELAADAGRVWRGGGLRVSVVPQDASFLRGDLRALARERGADVTQFFTILRKLGFSRAHLEADAGELSDGQKKKALLALSLCESAHLYIWDEPLNYIDALSRVQIEDLILRCQPTLLFVEHDMAFVRRVATRTVELPGAGEN